MNCSIEACTKPARTRGWCKAHYARWKRWGDPLAGRRPPTADDRRALLLSMPRSADGCWLWTRFCNPKGYGMVSYAGKTFTSHRLAYMLFVGPVPDGLQLDHLCRVRHCCNPAHLEPVTNAENRRRGLINQNVPKTHCPAGHPYDHVDPKTGWRRCNACFSAYRTEWRRQNPEAVKRERERSRKRIARERRAQRRRSVA